MRTQYLDIQMLENRRFKKKMEDSITLIQKITKNQRKQDKITTVAILVNF